MPYHLGSMLVLLIVGNSDIPCTIYHIPYALCHIAYAILGPLIVGTSDKLSLILCHLEPDR